MLTHELTTAQPQNAKLEKNQLIINEETTLEDWKKLGYYLSNIQGNVQFWIGDWAVFGTRKGYYTNSDVYDELEEITGLDRQTLYNYKNIADKLPLRVRLPNLSYTHHRQVTKLEESDQVYFLNRALQEKLTVAELRLQIITETSSRLPTQTTKYDNDAPFPFRLGDLHLRLQQEAFDMKTTIHDRGVTIIREYFEAKDKMIHI